MAEESAPAEKIDLSQAVTDAVAKWGPAVTKAVKEGDISDFKALFAPYLVEVVIQGGDGNEACFTISDENKEATLDWKTFVDMATADLKEQDFLKTECQCIGLLGPRCIMEQGRFNNAKELYHENIAVLTFNDKGQIVAYEAFTDPGVNAVSELAGQSVTE
ncbi:expressed unknown protein [Seminavis robusta]|uniref:Uncharacterized protein n=1 Tax=Seminavis robusta TaxID=568900 RepID=A0A9N8EPL7_9STRA|nr:expressed unknown protein [Seminavis robusta]|eukprot:Sro1607_g285600.1 n/a (161) ;mRNA; f:15074-15556